MGHCSHDDQSSFVPVLELQVPTQCFDLSTHPFQAKMRDTVPVGVDGMTWQADSIILDCQADLLRGKSKTDDGHLRSGVLGGIRERFFCDSA